MAEREAKRPKISTGQSRALDNHSKSPRSIVSWNCNGFNKRCLYNRQDVELLVRETGSPDLIVMQEAKMKQASASRPDTPCPQDLKEVEPALKEVFHAYTPFFSLSDKRHAGTLSLIHKRLCFDDKNCAFSFQPALNLLLKHFGLSREQVGLPPPPLSPKKKSQTTMTAFFKPKNPAK